MGVHDQDVQSMHSDWIGLIRYDNLVGGIVWTRLKNDGVKVSWDDDIPNMMGKS